MEQAQAFLAGLAPGAAYYVCPMHPEVVSDQKKDECPKCGMFLEEKTREKTAALPPDDKWIEGYACPMHIPQLVDHPGVCPLDACGMEMRHWRIERVASIPENAVIDTGTRYIVYTEFMPGIYDAREVILGLRAGAFYPVLDGIELGQQVVSNGAFLIDAEARLNPK